MLLDTRRHEKQSLNFISTAVGMKISGQFLPRRLLSNKKVIGMLPDTCRPKNVV